MHKALITLYALVSGTIAGVAASRLVQKRPLQPVPLTVTKLDTTASNLRITLSDGGIYEVATARNERDARNTLLLHIGKAVVVNEGRAPQQSAPDARQCWWITPILQADPVAIDAERYRDLRAAGLSERDIAYSYVFEAGDNVRDASTTLTADGSFLPSICAEQVK